MLYLIGIGLNPKHLTQEALECIRSADPVFLETYTSAYAQGSLKELRELTGKEIFPIQRVHVEEQLDSILASAQSNSVALLVFGNVFSATTHVQILLEAREKGVKVRFIPGISVFSFLGASGLDEYRFGRVSTIVFPSEHYAPDSFFDAIESNQKMGLHSLCLLDLDPAQGRFMRASEALEIIHQIELRKKKNLLSSVPLVILAGMGSESQQIKAGSFKELREWKCEVFPQSLIVCGKLTEKEKEALRELHGWNGNG
ncbi:MAG: diphthine synthase [Candidatus Diapherotrites archaeon]|nr:diphthine synthase [Candidatus Diapherotrites archaeon]